MIIAEAREKCKTLGARLRAIGQLPRDALILGVLLFASLLSFCLGYLTGLDAQVMPLIVEERTRMPKNEGGEIVASKSGVKYYYANCSGASRIAEANKVYFASKAEAEGAGYTLAVNCSEP